MKIRIIIGNKMTTATMYDNPTSRDFMSLMPLTLELRDYASTEKISDLPQKLSVKDAPSGSEPLVGDITYYAPWGNLALFYKDFSFSNGLIKLGKIDTDMNIFMSNGPVTAKFELLD
ncbi:cyclophilin-like fold protein [Bacteriovorax sp. PP10]|uniref:Cyclophilin-like fold protein n=1 Tax=Bacteriovorax antarcticus TaxID=3088717 RepID=A0ABU5VZA2_9BACT|nr:cyclophilin-like fold protein [Bacteriovorax sp. PP10]MEA9358406.1 cyclophilin-like fold protein [Bacteriovorax sp. PP10]